MKTDNYGMVPGGMAFPDAARLILSMILLAMASLAVITAPTHLIWMVAIGATELGHMLAIICLGVIPIVWTNSWVGKGATGICLAAAILASTPVLRAIRFNRDLPARLRTAFGEAMPSQSVPLRFGDLYKGVSPQEVSAETFVYSTIDGDDLSLDFYGAQSSGSAPLVVVVHGGSWQSGDNRDFISMNRYLAGRGFAVADIIYRLAPQSKFPAAVEDTCAAIAFLRSRADKLKIDSNRIVLLGRSAGGQIALTVAYSANDPGIRGVISLYAPTDLYYSWENPGSPLILDTKSILRGYLGGSPTEIPANYDQASPIRLVTPGSPPTLLLHGGRDELVSFQQSARLAKRLQEVGVPHLNLLLPWATHAYDYILRGPGGQISTYAIEYFLEAVMRNKNSTALPTNNL
jgi:acetyl esterase/lipase